MHVRVGDSVRPEDNARCGKAAVRLDRLVQTVACPKGLPGRFVSVEMAPAGGGGGAAQGNATAWPLCLCDVAPLSFVAPPQRAPNASASALPGAALNASAAAAAQSSGGGGAAAPGGGPRAV